MSIFAPLLVLVSLSGCEKGYVEEYVDGVRHLYTRTNSKKSGTATLELDVLPGETAFLGTIEVAEGFQTHFRSVTDPLGNQVFDAFEWTGGQYSKTNAGYVADTVTLNWPATPLDADLTPGTYFFEFGLVDAESRYVAQPLFADFTLKPDPSFENGSVRVAIVFAGGVENEDWLVSGVERAIEQWEELYISVGIQLETEIFSYPTGDLEPPGFGSRAEYKQIADSTGLRTVNVVFVEDIPGFEIFGIAGDIPGPLISTGRSAILVSALAAAGLDEQFSPEDERLLAETMAHEVGHYLGLFHPVESNYEAWDALGDTDECTGASDCESQLGRNVMYPSPLCNETGCTAQDEFTEAQGSVMHRYVGVE